MPQINIAELSALLAQTKARWTARRTPQSLLSDDEKKALLGVIFTQDDLDAVAAAKAGRPLAAAAAGPAAFAPAVDWRNHNGNHVTPVKDQMNCGSCVSFCCTALVELMASIEKGQLLDLSAADAHFCSSHGASCGGWDADACLDQIMARGVVPEGLFPYISAFDNPPQSDPASHNYWIPHCNNIANRAASAVKVTSHGKLGWLLSNNITDRKNYLSNNGPCAASFDVYDDFFSYGSGVYSHVTGGFAGGHCVEVIGYSEAEQCWICKNSWGSSFGSAGFFKIGYGECNFDTYAFATASGVNIPVTHVVDTRLWMVPSDGGFQPSPVWRSGQGSWSRSKMIAGDFQGTRKTDIAILHEYPNDDTGLWMFPSDGGFQPSQVWRSGQGNWSWSRSNMIAGDFQGTRKTDIAILYDYPNDDTGLWMFPSDGGFQPSQVWRSGQGNWSWSRSNMIAGDFQGTRKTDIAILYDYPNDDTGLWMFPSDGGFQPSQVWRSGQGNWSWSRSNMIAGDFQGTRKTDIAILYDYPNDDTGLWMFPSDGGFQPSQGWRSGQGNWSWSRSKMIAGDFQGTGKTDIAILYDYPNDDTGLWMFPSDGGFQPSQVWRSGEGNCSWSRSRLIAGDFQGSGKTDIAILYDYLNEDTGLWIFPSDGGFQPSQVWRSGPGNWSWSRSKMIAGDFQGTGKTDIAILYDYYDYSDMTS